MQRSITSVLAAGVLAISAAACSASGQSGCSQPPTQQYAAPTLVLPASGSSVAGPVTSIEVQTSSSTIVGTLTLTPSGGGAAITLGTGTLAAKQPNPSAYLWVIKTPTLSSGSYTLSWQVTYPGACLGPVISKASTIGTFSIH